MFRNVITRSSRTRCTANARPFSISTARRVEGYPNNASTNAKTKTDQYPDDKHAVNKAKDGDTNNIQDANVKAGMDADKNNKGGHATEGADSSGGAKKAKKEFPEAPDTIGMQDERGGRGA